MALHCRALVFDAYGTLFDPFAVRARAEELFPGHGQALTQLWRAKQLEYSWLRSLMGRYEDFWRLTADALDFSCQHLQLNPDAATRLSLLEVYLSLPAYPEVKTALQELSGRPLSILSNGTPGMLRAVVASNGLSQTFEHLLSVDALRIYKPDPRVYQSAVDRLNIPREHIGFVSSNFWDIAGATNFGFQTFWINRSSATPDFLGITPTATIHSLSQLPAMLLG